MARWKLKKLKKQQALPPKVEKKSKINKRNILLGCLLIIIITFAGYIVNFDPKVMYYTYSSNWISTIGVVKHYNSLEGIHQGNFGNVKTINGYQFKYSYTVDSSTFDKIENKGTSSGSFIKYILKTEKSRNVEVFYKKDNPKESYLNTDINSRFYKYRNISD